MSFEDRASAWMTSRAGRVTGASWNVLICGAIIVGSVIAGFTQSPAFSVLTAVAAAMEALFVCRLIRALREPDAATTHTPTTDGTSG